MCYTRAVLCFRDAVGEPPHHIPYTSPPHHLILASPNSFFPAAGDDNIRFEVLRRIGGGSFGEIYEGRNVVTGEAVGNCRLGSLGGMTRD